MSTPLQSAYSRVFIIDGGARPDHAPEFMSCMRAGSPDWGFGDITNIECPTQPVTVSSLSWLRCAAPKAGRRWT